MHKSRTTKFFTAEPSNFGSSVRQSFHFIPTGAQNFDVASIFVENLWTPDESVPTVPLYFCVKTKITAN